MRHVPHSTQPSALPWVLRARLCMWGRNRQLAEQYLASAPIASGQYPRAQQMLLIAAERERLLPDQVDLLTGGLGSDRSSPRGRTFFYQMHAELFSFYGNLELAVRGVARAVDAGLADLSWIERCPLIVALNADPHMPQLRRVVYERAIAVRSMELRIPPSSA